MALMRIDDYENQDTGGGVSRSVFWNLRVNAENGSQKAKKVLDDDKTIYGYQEDVWFLGRMKDVVFISAHRRDKMLYLCAKSFESEDDKKECPMCEEYFKDKATSKYSYRNMFAMIPVLVIRQQEDNLIVPGKRPKRIIPIQWFEMNVTSFRPDYKANFLRLRDANEKHKIHARPYRIFAKKRGEEEIQEWYFTALKESDKHAISYEHPIIDDWLDPKSGKWLWDGEYQKLLSALAIVRFKPYVDPQTREVFDYDGEYEDAVQIFEEASERFGAPYESLEEGEYDEYEDDEEELD
jgi:hypothetical protein